jgi:hypothetical protein
VKADGVELVKLAVSEGVQMVDHELKYPLVEKDVSYYYAVVCVDNAGNESNPGISGKVTNLAKGVATINPTAPINFKADGDLSEWAAIKPIRMFLSDGSGHLAANFKVDGDADLSLNAYLAVDQDNLYVAFDVTDDIVSFNPLNAPWENDTPDLFIGLYNQLRASHTFYMRGNEPDYHLLFAKDRFLCGRPWVDSLLVPGANYNWSEKFASGYSVEAKIPWTLLASIGSDSVFHPQVGMKIPIDYSINDADATGSREGMLTLSKLNDDTSYDQAIYWTYTWIGDKTTVDVKDEGIVATSFSLAQNYPNPFNPTTQIKYSIPKSSFVSLIIFDVLGREVSTLVNQAQNNGTYTVSFNAAAFSTGVYVYKLEAGDFTSIKKMLLIK